MGGFDQGWALGSHFAERNADRKAGLSDEEREQKLGDYNNVISNIQQKLSQVGENDPQYSTLKDQLGQVIQDRTMLFHPSQGPGALAHLGRLTWQHVHGKPQSPARVGETPVAGAQGSVLPGMGGGAPIVTPALPAGVAPFDRKPDTPPTPAGMKARFAQDLSYGTPADPLQAAGRLAAFNRDQKGLNQDFEIQWAQKHGVSPEALNELTQHLAGVPAPKTPKQLPGAKPYKGADGRYYVSAQDPVTGEIEALAEPPDFVPPVAPGSIPKVGSFGDFMSAAYGLHPTAQQYQEGRRAWTPLSTTTGVHTVMIRQANGDIVPVQIETTSTKGGGVALPSARQDVETPPGSSSPTPAAPSLKSATAPTPGTLRKKAQAIVAPAGGKSKAGVVSIGNAVGHVDTSTENKAAADVLAAQKLNSLADQAAATKEPGQQKQLALALIKAMAGRVNMQEYAVYTTGYGVPNTVAGLTQRIENGGLAPGILNQLVNDAHANLKAAKDAQTAIGGNGAGNSEQEVDDFLKNL